MIDRADLLRRRALVQAERTAAEGDPLARLLDAQSLTRRGERPT